MDGGGTCLTGIIDLFCMKCVTKTKPSIAINRNWKKVTMLPAPGSSLEVRRTFVLYFHKFVQPLYMAFITKTAYEHNPQAHTWGTLPDNELQKDHVGAAS